MLYGSPYNIGTATLDSEDLSIVHIDGASLTGEAVRGDHFELVLGVRRIRIDDVLDAGTLRLMAEWPDEPFENAAYVIIRDAEARAPELALARNVRDRAEQLRIFNKAKPVFGIVEFGVNSPPGGYAVGDMCVVGSAPSGVFSGWTNSIAEKTEAGWHRMEPEYGWHVISQTDPNGSNLIRTWDGSAWILSAGLAAGIEFVGEWIGTGNVGEGDDVPIYTNGKVVLHAVKLWIALVENQDQEPGQTEGYWIEYPVPGEHGGVPIPYRFSSDISSDPLASGHAKINNAAPGSANILRLHKQDVYGGDWSSDIAAIGTSTTSNQKGKVRLQKIGDKESFVATVMTVAVDGDMFNLTISSPSAPNGFFDDDDLILFYFQERGDKGEIGLTGPHYRGTSATSLTVGATSPITFTTQGGLAYTLGARYRINKSDDAEVWLEGFCTAYNATTGSFTGTVEKFKGSGAVGSWNLNLIGQPGEGYKASSTTSLSIPESLPASRTFTVQPNLAYTVGARGRASAVGDVAWMEGLVTAYNGTTGEITISIDKTNNSGTFGNWNFNLVGHPGANGANGVDGASALTRIRLLDTEGGDPTEDYQASETVDGVALQENDLICRATPGGDELDGVYVVPASGPASRHAGFDEFNDFPAAEFNIAEGDGYAGTKWRCISPFGGTLGSDPVTIIQALSMDGANNLSEITDAAAARDNLGLGDVATLNVSQLPDPVGLILALGG